MPTYPCSLGPHPQTLDTLIVGFEVRVTLQQLLVIYDIIYGKVKLKNYGNVEIEKVRVIFAYF